MKSLIQFFALSILTIHTSHAQIVPNQQINLWKGLNDTITLIKNERKTWSTPQLPTGSYIFELSGKGDADLYVKIGNQPTLVSYDCRPYKTGSYESCTAVLNEPQNIFIMVVGSAARSTIRITGRKK